MLAAFKSSTVKLLLDHHADPNQATSNGFTPLIQFAASGNEQACRLLLMHGADKNLRTSKGVTAEDAARKAGHEKLARMIADWPAH